MLLDLFLYQNNRNIIKKKPLMGYKETIQLQMTQNYLFEIKSYYDLPYGRVGICTSGLTCRP